MAVLNLSTLRSELGQKIKKTNLSNTRLDRWLNMAVDDIVSEIDCDHLIEHVNVTTVSGQTVYYLGDVEYNKILSVSNTTSEFNLYQRSEYDIEDIDPGLEDAGTPYFYYDYGYSEYEGQPVSTATLKIVSDSASDLTQRVRIVGKSGGVERTEILTLNGTSTVTGSITWDAVSVPGQSTVYGIRKDSTTVGKVTVTSNDSASTVLSKIAPTQLIRQYQPLYLFYVPNSAITLRVRLMRKPRPMVNAEDIPDVGSDQYHELVLIGASIRGHRDVFQHAFAKKVLEEEWLPLINKFKKQQGNKRGRKSPIIGGDRAYFELGRLQPRFGTLD